MGHDCHCLHFLFTVLNQHDILGQQRQGLCLFWAAFGLQDNLDPIPTRILKGSRHLALEVVVLGRFCQTRNLNAVSGSEGSVLGGNQVVIKVSARRVCCYRGGSILGQQFGNWLEWSNLQCKATSQTPFAKCGQPLWRLTAHGRP